MEPVSFFSQLRLEMAQGKISWEYLSPRRNKKQNEEEFAAWRKALTSGLKVHTWSSELPWAWASLVLQATRTKRSHTEGCLWLVSKPSVDKLVLKKSSGVV